MDKREVCESCNQSRDCKEVYGRLGGAEGPSVAWRAVLAFLLPMVVFIACLAASERVLTGAVKSGACRTAVSVVLALLAAFVCVLVVRALERRHDKGGYAGES
ncbi:MAG: hypothetical protein ACYTBJ_14515 [Planctomycetota bacterium]|jgi:hypothetical protein